MTHGADGRDLVARCPVGAWERAGIKAFTVQSWCELALKVSNDEENLYGVMKVSLRELSNEGNVDPVEVKEAPKTSGATRQREDPSGWHR
eukprot:8939089-Pyramimonas_sp.AAC.1